MLIFLFFIPGVFPMPAVKDKSTTFSKHTHMEHDKNCSHQHSFLYDLKSKLDFYIDFFCKNPIKVICDFIYRTVKYVIKSVAFFVSIDVEDSEKAHEREEKIEKERECLEEQMIKNKFISKRFRRDASPFITFRNKYKDLLAVLLGMYSKNPNDQSIIQSIREISGKIDFSNERIQSLFNMEMYYKNIADCMESCISHSRIFDVDPNCNEHAADECEDHC